MVRSRAARERFHDIGLTDSAGIYLQFFLASAVMQLLFWVLMVLRWWSGIESGSVDPELRAWSTFAVTLMMGLGWMMLVGFGIAFSVWPILFQSLTFSPSLPKAVLRINVGGQLLIAAAHLLIFSHPTIATQMLTMATTMICISLAIACAPAIHLLRQGRHRIVEHGSIHFIPVLVLLLVSLTTMIAWLTRSRYGGDVQHFTEGLYLLLSIDLLWMSLGLAIALGHFGRRLEWSILVGWRAKVGLPILLFLFAIHALAMLADHSGWNDVWWIQLSFALPLLWIFILLSPKCIVEISVNGAPYSKPIMAAVLWLPIIAAIGVYEALYTNDNLYTARYLLLFGVGVQALFGAAIWYHQDHKNEPIQGRRQPWIFLIALNASLAIHLTLMLTNQLGISILKDHGLTGQFELITLAIAMISWLSWWLWELLFSLHDWNRIPMFYSTLHQDDDPYEIADGSN
ncbi:MAG TPA: hypothetical protein EYQ80_00305 [Candidatus Poseidoniales archaeon]|nr:hypothetical protein [Candidatus Poseidoniales archaeon]